MTEDQDRPSDPDAETSAVPPPGPGGPDPDVTMSSRSAAIPRKVAGYTVKRVLASGGMGTVYLATQEQPRRTVALKVMRAGIASESALRRFEYEAQILARLHHPNIAQVYEAGTHDAGDGGVPFFAMEYVPNARPITDFAEVRKLGTRERLDLFATVCDAIHHGHQKGIIHRDLKPGNILVDSSGEVKIIDFGVARATDSDLAVTTLQTDVGQLIGTLQYMSPEQCEADPHDLDVRSDVYALGVVLYEMLCGQLPYDVTRVAIHEAARLIREETPARPSTVNRTLRGDVETITLKALEKDRKRRYQSAADLGGDILHYLNHEPITAHPPSVVYQIQMLARKHKALFGAATAVAAGLVIGVVGLWWGLHEKTLAEREASAERDAAIVAKENEAAQRAIAIEAGARAERRFEDVRDLARTFMHEFHDEIKTLEGSVPARELLVTTALEYLERLEADSGDDPGLLGDVAAGHERVGDILGGLRGGNLGKVDEALVHYRTALEIRQRLLELDPDGDEAWKGVLHAQVRLGDAHSKQDQHELALAEYREAAQIADDLLASDPADRDRSRLVATTRQKVGDMLAKLGDVEGAAREFAKSLRRKRRLVEADPTDLVALRDLSTALIRIGYSLSGAGEIDAALPYYEEAVAIRTRLLEAEPESGRARRDRMLALYRIGYAQIAKRELASARETFAEAVDTAKRLYEADRGDARAREGLVEMYGGLARAAPDDDVLQEAIDYALLDLAALRAAAAVRTEIAAAEALLTSLGATPDGGSD